MGNSIDIKKVLKIMAIVIGIVAVALLIILNLNTSKKTGKTVNGRVNNEFNSRYLIYDGKKNGSSVRELLALIIDNNKNNSNDATKLVDIKYQLKRNGKFKEAFSNVANVNTKEFENVRASLEPKHEYYVEFVYSKKTGNISGIIIKYEDTKESFIPDEL